MATLRLVPVSGQPIDAVKDQTVVGRDPSCEIVVADGSVSRRHARLEQRGGIWWVVDQGSANGTYLNSLRIAEQALKNGQELRFGALAFRVDLKEDPEATVATPVLKDDSATLLGDSRAAAAARPSPQHRRRCRSPAAAAAARRARAAERRRGQGALQGRSARAHARGGLAGAADARGPGPGQEGQEPAPLDRRGLLRLPAARRASSRRRSSAAPSWPPRAPRTPRTPGSARCARARARPSQAGLSESYRSQLDAQELEQITDADRAAPRTPPSPAAPSTTTGPP